MKKVSKGETFLEIITIFYNNVKRKETSKYENQSKTDMVLFLCKKLKNRKEKNMKKGIIAATAVVICAMLAATYAFAAPGKAEKKDVKKEVTTTEKQKETTTAEKPKTETKESEEPNIEETGISTEEESDIENAEEVSDDQEESDDSEEEIDDEEMDHCNHEWVQTGYAADPDFQTGYAIEQECKKCHLCKGIEISQEEFEEATKEDQESYADEGCEYEDSEDVEVVE